jgi:hypothetical protein
VYTSILKMAAKENNKITTIKIKKDTKERIDHFKEYRRESYDDLIEKMLHILILRDIDSKVKRKHQVYSSIPPANKETQEKIAPKINPQAQERRPQNTPVRSKFIITRKMMRK